MKTATLALACTAAICCLPVVAMADTFSLNDNHGGDGYMTQNATGFDLYSAANGSASDTILYSGVAAVAEALQYSYLYSGADGPGFDPATVTVNGVATALAPQNLSVPGMASSGVAYLTAGESYMLALTSQSGAGTRGDLHFDLNPDGFGGSGSSLTKHAGVPEPQAWTMMLLGVGAMGARLRSRGRRAAAA